MDQPATGVPPTESRKDSNNPALDEAARAPTETKLRTVDVEAKRSERLGGVKADKTKAKAKAGVKTSSRKGSRKTSSSKRDAQPVDASDSDSSEDDAEQSEESDDDSSDSDSDSDADCSSPKKNYSSKRHPKPRSKKKATKRDKKRRAKKTTSSKRAVTPESDSDDDSSEISESAEEDNDEKSIADAGQIALQQALAQQIQNLTLRIAQFQQQLSPQMNQLSQLGSANAMSNALQGGFGAQNGLTPTLPLLSPQQTLNAQTPLAEEQVISRRGQPVRRPRGGAVRNHEALLRQLSETNDADSGGGTGTGDTKKKTKNKKLKKGTRMEFKRVDWIWDNNLYTYKLQDTSEAASESQYDEYIFHVRRTFDPEGRYRSTIVDIKSKLLRECLQDVMGNVKGLSLVDETPKMDPNLLFLYLDDLRKHRKHLKQAMPAGEGKRERKKNQKRLDSKRKQLKVLIEYLDKDYAKIKESLHPMLQSGLVTFDLLWALWKPNTLAYATTYGSSEDPRVFKVEIAERQSTLLKGDFYYIDGRYFEFDGKKFGYGGFSEEVPEFRGAKKITTLPCYPLQYHKDEAKLKKELIERGKKFVQLSGVHYKGYSGIAYQKRKKSTIKYNIQQSRIMVDPSIFRRINPNYYVSTVRPKDHDLLSVMFSDDSDACDCEGRDSSSGSEGEGVRYVTKVYKTEDGGIRMAHVPKDAEDEEKLANEKLDALPSDNSSGKGDENGDTPSDGATAEKEPPEFSDEEYLIASPTVLGFSFAEKQWVEFSVSRVKDIKWNEDAWDSLVMEPATKDLIQALVKSRKYSAAQTIDDVIQGKGKGLVTVLHGPPGTGKTLTAEGISELLKCPLYMASAGELGTDSRYLEAELQKILDICHAWGAILLLDEADVFLEKRNMHDIHRNALVSIFLRQLEYFQGILFLTTNRVETFDEAFQSRIHIALRYDALDVKAKRAIFKMFIDRVRSFGKLDLEPFEDKDLDALARKDLNGREIKNVVGSAQDLAVNKGEALGMRHIRQVLDVHAKFGRDLKGGSGYEDAMRSYF